ncbi:MAG: amidohydrolase family protein [Gammaproteobacteria bacterium]
MDIKQLKKFAASCALVFGCALLASAAAAGQRVILDEGSAIHVTTDATGRRISFDLAGLVWVMDPADGNAKPVTAATQLARYPILAPDGQQLAYLTGLPGQRQLQLLSDLQGSPKRLSFGPFDHATPTWHPDGQRLAFASNRGGDLSIWEIDVASLDLNQRTFSPGTEKDPAYDAQGQRLAYVGNTPQGQGLFVIDADGETSLELSVEGSLHAPSWRPDGSLLTFVYRSAGVSELRMLILSKPRIVKALTRGENVFASPARWLDKKTFIYAADGRIRRRRFDDFSASDLPFRASLELPARPTAARQVDAARESLTPVQGITGFAQTGGRRFVSALGDIWELDRDGAVVSKLSNAPDFETQLTAAPDGSLLAFLSDRSGELQLWVMDTASGTSRQLTQEQGVPEQPAWRQDGNAIAYLVAPHPGARTRALKTVALDTGEVNEVARSLPRPTSTDWSPNGLIILSRSSGGLLAYTEEGQLARLPASVPTNSSAVRWSPDGSLLAWVQAGQLRLSALQDTGEWAPAVDIAGAASQPRWIDAGRSLAWLGTDGLMAWAIADRSTTSLPLHLTWQAGSQPEEPLVIRAGRVFDGLGPDYEYAQDIVIKNGRIVSMGPWRDPPPGKVFDARQLTVMPGLIDLEVRPDGPQAGNEGRAWLAYGVTSIREFSRNSSATLERLESWASGQRPGPRLFPVAHVCGTPGDGVAASFARRARQLQAVAVELCDAETGRVRAEWIAQAQAAGLISITPGIFPGALLGADETRLLGNGTGLPEAANRFIYGDVIDIAGAGRLTSISGLSAVGLATLDRRSSWFDEAAFSRLFGAAQRSWYEQSWQQQAGRFGPALRAEARTAGQSLFRAVGRGARVVTGSVSPAVPPGLGTQAELQLLRATGLQSFEVLRMATRDAAAALGAQHQLGRIGPGMLADLVLVAGDPLQDITATGEVVATVAAGRLYPRESLLNP